MTDKQIIIKRIRDCDNCKFRPETSKVCSDYENCYMVSEYICNLRKQLKRKEQELQEAMDNYVKLDNQRVKEYNELVDLYKTKEQECERLKEKLCSFENCTNFEKYGKEIAKLKQTLNEIKQIAIREFETSRYNGSFTWKQILQKINEVECEN